MKDTLSSYPVYLVRSNSLVGFLIRDRFHQEEDFLLLFIDFYRNPAVILIFNFSFLDFK
nr:MAG TPA: hypothetical protein [Caudoviricetes sp.]